MRTLIRTLGLFAAFAATAASAQTVAADAAPPAPAPEVASAPPPAAFDFATPMPPSMPPARPPRTPEQIAAENATKLLDWPAMARYRDANAALAAPDRRSRRVVFLGDSITQNWARFRPEFFADNGYVGRGISGQTSPQMVLRFHQDVVALKPAVVLILAGTNDIAENTGPISDEQVIDNLTAIVEMARANKIKVVIGSITPATYFFWKPDATPTAHVMALNAKIKAWASAQNLTYADFWSAMAMPDGATNPAYANDSVHPNANGYGVMEPIAVAAIQKALKRR